MSQQTIIVVLSCIVTLLVTCIAKTAAHPLFTLSSSGTYPTQPNEILSIQPLLIYPTTQHNLYQARNIDSDDDDDIIYVRLVQGKGYHPKQQAYATQNRPDSATSTKELSLKDIFYVKARTNGMFSKDRLKVFRLPEFYAISVYRNNDKLP